MRHGRLCAPRGKETIRCVSLLDYCTISLVFLSSEGTFPVAQGYGTVGAWKKEMFYRMKQTHQIP